MPYLKGQRATREVLLVLKDETAKGFVYQLEKTINDRIDSNDPNSYTNDLYQKGINKVAQKVGEEAVELVIEAKDSNDDLFKNEAADLIYHLLILLKKKNMSFTQIEEVLKKQIVRARIRINHSCWQKLNICLTFAPP